MMALSIKQPWAWAIFHGKDVENRTWRTSVVGTIVIHTGKGFDHKGYMWLRDNAGLLDAPLPSVSGFRRGGVIGLARLAGCVDYMASPWFFGPWGFVLRDQRVLSCFIQWPGKQGFFDIPRYHLVQNPGDLMPLCG